MANRYDIDNAKVIGRVLPFYIRGRKISIFLYAIAYPLVTLHETFKIFIIGGKRYACEKIEASITSQTLTMEWYLTYLFKDRFEDETASFRITDNFSDQSGNDDTFITITAPKIVEISLYSMDDYIKDIHKIVDSYITNFKKYKIVLQ